MMAKRCVKCALPESYPGIKLINNKCNYCYYHEIYAPREAIIEKILKRQFIKAIKQIKKKKNSYDCVVAFSGGKDSTFLLYYLKKQFRLNILAHTLDNGFISKKALENIDKITKVLNIDHKITKPDFDMCKEIFTYALSGDIPYPKEILAMLSPICAACIGMVFGTTLNLSIKLNIPIMFVGFTPGQYPMVSLENFLKVNSCMFLSENVYKDDPIDIIKMIRDPIEERFGGRIEKYFFKSQYIKKGVKVPTILFPFHGLLDYDEKDILKQITKLGWERPQDTDSCSTNCLLNTLGNYSCVEQLGYHPYIGELSYLVRQNKMSRKQAIEAEKIDKDSFAMRHSLNRLGIKKTSLRQK